jgi:hypothetical protein
VRRLRTRTGVLTLAGLFFAIAAIAQATVVQQGNLQVTILSQVSPYHLPRNGSAPVAIFIAGHIATANGTAPPQLEKLAIKLNRHGNVNYTGLPACSLSQIQPNSTQHALQACSRSLVGSGQFWAEVVLPGQAPYPTQGRLLVFNGREGGRPVLFAHIYATNPFDTSFVIPFSIHYLAHGAYGTELSASLPGALGSWGFVNRIKMTISHRYRYGGKTLSFVNAGCPAPSGFTVTNFTLAQATFSFAGGQKITENVTHPCAVSR